MHSYHFLSATAYVFGKRIVTWTNPEFRIMRHDLGNGWVAIMGRLCSQDATVIIERAALPGMEKIRIEVPLNNLARGIWIDDLFPAMIAAALLKVAETLKGFSLESEVQLIAADWLEEHNFNSVEILRMAVAKQ